MKELQEDNLKVIVDDSPKVFVMFGASWCGNCRLLKPKVRRLSEENEGVEYVYVDAEKYPDSRSLAKVENLPTFAIYNEGALVNQVTTSKYEHVKELSDEITNI